MKSVDLLGNYDQLIESGTIKWCHVLLWHDQVCYVTPRLVKPYYDMYYASQLKSVDI